MNVADQVVEMLIENGVKRIYAVTGDSLNILNDAVRRNGKIKWIHVRNEEAGAFAAAAEAELEGLACCAGSSGPGHVHLINGLYHAHAAGIPLIAIAATMATAEFGTHYFQETNTIKLFDDCSCYNQVACTPQQAPRMLQAVIQHAVHQKGVAVFGLPGDVSAMKAEESSSSMYNYRSQSIMRPNDVDLDKLADILNENTTVTIYCGIGCTGAHDEVVQLAELLKATVGHSFRGKMEVQYDNPYDVGMTGLLGLPAAYHSMHESDVVLLLGTDFPYTPFYPTKNIIIQIDEKAEKLGRRAKLELGLCGKIKDTLQALLPKIKNKEEDIFLHKQLRLKKETDEHLLTYVKDNGKENLLSPEYVAHTIDKLAAEDAIFTLDTGLCCVWGARYITPNSKRKMLGSFNHGSMANAMPQAIGASLTYPQRQIIAFCGDGGLSMLLGDLATIKQYKLPIKLMVFNNRSLGLVKIEMEVAGLPDNETDMINPDFAMIAEAMGFKGITVNQPADLEQAVKEAFDTDGPVLVNIMTNPNSLAMPPKVEWKQMVGFGTSMTKLALSGHFGEVVETVKSNYKHIKEVF